MNFDSLEIYFKEMSINECPSLAQLLYLEYAIDRNSRGSKLRRGARRLGIVEHRKRVYSPRKWPRFRTDGGEMDFDGDVNVLWTLVEGDVASNASIVEKGEQHHMRPNRCKIKKTN